MKKYAFCLLLTFLCFSLKAQKQVEKLKPEYLLVFPIQDVTHLDKKESQRPAIKSILLNETHAVLHYLTENNGEIGLGITVHKILSIRRRNKS